MSDGGGGGEVVDVVLALPDVDGGDVEVIVVVPSQQGQPLLFPPEALAIAKLVALFAGSAVFALVVNAAGRVGETDLAVEEILGLAYGADSVGVGLASAVDLFTLEETVEEVPLSTSQAFLRRLLAPLQT